MVVRLGGSGSDVAIVNSQRYRVLQGQALSLQYISSSSVTARAWARIRYDSGEDEILFIADQALSSDPVAVTLTRPSDVARLDGWVTDALVEMLDANIKRGQVYVKLFFDPFGPVLCSDYCYSDFGQVALGTYIQPGPGGGGGNLEIVTLIPNISPVPDTTISLAASNTIRKILSVVWYYHCSADVASRTMRFYLQNPLGAFPTGLTDKLVWEGIAVITLTANEEGAFYVDHTRSLSSDEGVVLITDASVYPPPFPLLVEAGDNIDVVFITQNEEANDRNTAYLLRESWVMP